MHTIKNIPHNKDSYSISIIVPVHNEEKNIVLCFNSLISAVKNSNLKYWKIYFILNGCTDQSEQQIKKIQNNHSKNVIILKSKFGKTISQTTAINKVNSKNILIFVDADVTIDKNSIKRILKCFESNKKILVVGAIPVPIKPRNKQIIYYILNLPAIFPKLIIPKTSISIDKCMKNYFIGRLFALRSKRYWLLKNEIFPDDVLLIDKIYNKYGVNGVFRYASGAKCYYLPYLSLRSHYYAHFKNYLFLMTEYKIYPKLKRFSYLYSERINYDYIKTLPYWAILSLCGWLIITRIENILYLISSKMNKRINGNYIWKKKLHGT